MAVFGEEKRGIPILVIHGGTFIATQKLNPWTRVVQTNPVATFEEFKEIMSLFKQLNEKDGVTIVQVTHSEYNASFGHRIIKLKDGWIS